MPNSKVVSSVQESIDFLGTMYRNKITPGPLILTKNNTQPSDILDSDNVAEYNKEHPHERIDVFNNTWQHLLQNYSTLYSFNVTKHASDVSAALIEYIGNHVKLVPSTIAMPPISVPTGPPKAVLSELDWFTFWATSITSGQTRKASKAVQLFDDMMPVVSHSLHAVIVESRATDIEIHNLRIIDDFVNLHVEIDEVIDQCTALTEEVNRTGGFISGTTRIDISNARIHEPDKSAPPTAPGVVETLFLWYDQANGIAKAFVRYGASTVFMWYDPTLSRKTNLALMSSTVLTATMILMPKKTVGGLVAVIASTIRSGLIVADTGKQAATVMMSIVKDVAKRAGQATWEVAKGTGQAAWENGKGIVTAIPTYLVSIVGSTMKFMIMVAVKHPIGVPVLLVGLSIGGMVTERTYKFIYITVPSSLSPDDKEHITRATVNVLRGAASLVGSSGEVLEEVSESIKDAIVQTKATIGSAAFGYTAAAFLGVAVSLYIGLESNRQKSATAKKPAKQPVVKKRRLK